MAATVGFNPRARGGRDIYGSTGIVIASSFNPRARGGRDRPLTKYDSVTWLFQSTRPRGARLSLLLMSLGTLCFNPRARGGRDKIQGDLEQQKKQFQSTRPRGARLYNPAEYAIIKLFQSTRPRGARPPRNNNKRWILAGFNPRARGGRDSG